MHQTNMYSSNALIGSSAAHVASEIGLQFDALTPAASPVTLELVDGAEWDWIASRFDDVNNEQTNRFNAARWGVNRLEHAVVKQGKNIIGGAVVIVLALPGTRQAMALIKWGPLWRRIGAMPNPAHLHTVLTALTREYVDRRQYYVSIFPHADPAYGELTTEVLKDFGYKPGWSHNDPDRYLVNVALSEDELHKSLSQKWRYNLRKSAANGLDITLDDNSGNLAVFMKLYDEMLARKRFQDTSPIATLPSLMQTDVPAFRPEVVIVRHDGTPTAGAVIDVSGNRAVYLYGATDERALKLNAGYAMHWWIAQRLCRNGAISWYDLGGKDGDQGLHQFKKGFVGKQGHIVATPPSFELATSWQAQAFGRSIYALRDIKAGVKNAFHRAGAMMCS